MAFDPASRIQDQLVFGEFGDVNPSITDSSTYTFLDPARMAEVFEHEIEGCFLYSRHWNPTNRFLADALSRIKGIQIAHEVQTNIVIFDVAGTGLAAADLSARLKSRGVLMNPVRGTLMRFVTHLDASRADCEAAAEIFPQCLEKQ